MTVEFLAWQERVVARIDQLLDKKAKALGGKFAILDSLEMQRNFFSDLRRRPRDNNARIPLDDIFPVVEALGEHPIELLYEAGRDLDASLPMLPRPQGGTPTSPVSQEILEELEAGAAVDCHGSSEPGTRIEAMRGFCTWRRLHRLVLSEPYKVLDDARPALLFAEPALRPRILAVVGTALRKTGDLDGAAHLINRAIEQATALGDLWTQADAMHRLSRVTLETGEVDEAIRQIREAGALYAEQRDAAGVGRTLMSQGHYFAHKEDFPRAERLFRASLRQLPSSEVDFRFVAMTNLARIAMEAQRLEPALRWLRAATTLSAGVAAETAFVGRQTRGAVAFELGNYEEAIDCFYQCRRFYLDAGIPLEAAYSTVWLFHALLKTGRIHELVVLSKESLALVGLLKGNRVAAGVMASLLRKLKAGEIRATQLVEYRQKLGELRKDARPNERAS